MQKITIAIGDLYLKEAQGGIVNDFTDTVLFSHNSGNYINLHSNPLINGLSHKCLFANYLDETIDGPVFLLDADLHFNESSEHNVSKDVAFDTLISELDSDTDIAFARYEGNYHYPPTQVKRREIYEKMGGNANSGLVYFKDYQTAKAISDIWVSCYRTRMGIYGTEKVDSWNEYDEPALMQCLTDSMPEFKWQFFDKKWHTWSGDKSGIFYQYHEYNANMYDNIPRI